MTRDTEPCLFFSSRSPSLPSDPVYQYTPMSVARPRPMDQITCFDLPENNVAVWIREPVIDSSQDKILELRGDLIYVPMLKEYSYKFGDVEFDKPRDIISAVIIGGPHDRCELSGPESKFEFTMRSPMKETAVYINKLACMTYPNERTQF